MIIRAFVILSCIAWTLSASGQYSYFNLLYGQADDLESESLANIEWHPEGLISWGGGVDTSEVSYFVISYDEYGQQTNQSTFHFGPEYVYPGLTNSFSLILDHGVYLHTQGSYGGPEGSVAFAMMVDENLDTLWTRRYHLFDENTYFESNTPLQDGALIAGSFYSDPTERGSFIAEMDLQGDILWQQVVHEPNEGVYRMTDLALVGNRIVTTGGKGVGDETTGVMDILDAETHEVLWNYENEGDGRLNQLSTDTSTIILEFWNYADFEPLDNPQYAFSSITLSTVDFESQTLQLENELFTESEYVRPFLRKGVHNPDGSIVFEGGAFKLAANEELDRIGLMVKLDSDYEIEWLTELRFDDGTCTTCASYLWDMEPIADGGYVGAGYFIDYAIDGRRRSWLIKVDACGDVVYNGCGAEELSVGMAESEALEDSGIRVYPNPSSNVVHIEVQEVGASVGIILRDLQGREILRSTYRPDTPIDIATLPAGSYLIEALRDDGSRIGISVIEIVK